MVRDFLGVSGAVAKPEREHPSVPSRLRVHSLRSERFEALGFAQSHFKRGPLLRRLLRGNYCPLVFMDEGGKNLTPDKLPKASKSRLSCMRRGASGHRERAEATVRDRSWRFCASPRAARIARVPGKIGMILHPSPASPKANRGWAAIASKNCAISARSEPRCSGSAVGGLKSAPSALGCAPNNAVFA